MWQITGSISPDKMRFKRDTASDGCTSHHCDFFTFPKNLAFSSEVWKRPWPIFDEVSINFNVTCSCALRLVCASNVLRRVTTRHLAPLTEPFKIKKSSFTSP